MSLLPKNEDLSHYGDGILADEVIETLIGTMRIIGFETSARFSNLPCILQIGTIGEENTKFEHVIFPHPSKEGIITPFCWVREGIERLRIENEVFSA